MHPGMDASTQHDLVRRAMAQARLAAARGDAPFGAVLATADGQVLLEAANAQLTAVDPTAHAEIVLIRAAARELGRTTLEGLVLASNAEPCSMCASALVKARVGTILFGAPHEPHMDPDIDARTVVSRSRYQVSLIGPVLGDECAREIAAARAGTPAPD